jgi:hypothetical protein
MCCGARLNGVALPKHAVGPAVSFNPGTQGRKNRPVLHFLQYFYQATAVFRQVRTVTVQLTPD